MRLAMYLGVMALLCGMGGGAMADPAAPLSALAKMPVKEITVFKDGHAFVLHEGKMPTDAKGDVQMDYLPTPVIGTFWPYSGDKNIKLTAVTASPRKVLVERTSLSVRELLEANPGADVNITQVDGKSYSAKIVEVPRRSSAELEGISPPHSGEKLPEKGTIILLKTSEGTQATPLDRIQSVTFKGDYKKTQAEEEFRNLLTLKLDWPGGKAGKTAEVGMVYLQKGVRWIPSYRIAINGKGEAVVKLQATLLNELADLDDVTANLVIGVPSFAFKETPDPISLQQSFAQLSSYFQTDSRTSYAFSNSIMSQQAARGGERFQPAEAGGGANLGPEVAGAEKSEDLYVFTVKHISIRKGQRMVLPVAEYTLKYKDVYTLDMPFSPPRELRANISTDQQAELARLINAPKVMHTIRLTNQSKYPLTTAPALILNGDRVLAQGMTTYTAVGADSDLALTVATDVRVKKSDKETQRTPNAVNWQGNNFGRIDLNGTITITNFGSQPIALEVTRNVLGNVGKADHGGDAAMVNVFEDETYAPRTDTPYWWGYYSWPSWWSHFNGVGRIKWKLTLEPGKSVELGYTWHYYWQ